MITISITLLPGCTHWTQHQMMMMYLQNNSANTPWGHSALAGSCRGNNTCWQVNVRLCEMERPLILRFSCLLHHLSPSPHRVQSETHTVRSVTFGSSERQLIRIHSLWLYLITCTNIIIRPWLLSFSNI